MKFTPSIIFECLGVQVFGAFIFNNLQRFFQTPIKHQVFEMGSDQTPGV
jgi:hypothetical protein